jgi:hypothetical protein
MACCIAGSIHGGFDRMPINLVEIRQELESRVLERTGRRILNLDIELQPEHVVLHGQVSSFHVKQLAQQGVREFMPEVRLVNAIQVA